MGQLVVLAYSGGLDTSAIVPWLKEHYDARVLCYAADVGQGEGELDGLEAKAVRSGAVGCVVDDLRERFVTDFVFPTLKAGAIYGTGSCPRSRRTPRAPSRDPRSCSCS